MQFQETSRLTIKLLEHLYCLVIIHTRHEKCKFSLFKTDKKINIKLKLHKTFEKKNEYLHFRLTYIIIERNKHRCLKR